MAEGAAGDRRGDEEGGLCEDEVESKVLDVRLRARARPTRCCFAAQCFLVVGALFAGFLLGRASNNPALVKQFPAMASGQATQAFELAGLFAPAVTTTITTTTTTTTTPEPPPWLRLIINSHVKYSKPLGLLYESLLQAGFKSDMRHAVVVFGGSRADTRPYLAPGKWGELGVTYINSTLNAFDVNALSALFHNVDDPRVRARAYLYIHDTVMVEPKSFLSQFRKIAKIIGEDEIRLPGTPNSNIYAFGHKVVRSYRTNFDVNFTKGEAVNLEWGHGKVKHIREFAKRVTGTPGRQFRGMADPYHTKVPRHKYWYPDFHLYKFILMHKYGDIAGGGLKPNFPR